uniref:Uncharacterized protein n=1 Tax=Ciona savignyi TaxID=51511 RepID=H2YZ42_CIOSA
MIVACLVGFYVFYKNERPVVLESTVLLDEVLLLICMLGPLVSNSFSLLAIIAGEENKTDKTWVVSMIFRLCDTFQCLLQVVLVLFGLQREPETTEYAKDTVDQIKKSFQAIQATDEDDHLGSRNEIENIAQSYLRSRHNSINSVISALFSNPGHQTFQDEPEENTRNLATITQTIDRGDNVSICLSIREQTVQHIDPASPKIEINGIALEASESLEIETSCCENPERETNNKKSIIKVVSQSKVSQPRGGRLVLREVSMFLLIANACLWMYMSLDGTAFSLYLYQSQFFGASVWTTILMICRPLSIFFRMHSAGCLFEIWSFA